MHMGWSYRTADDDDGVNPYGGETMSTAAHHASAVTITAGLGGGRGGHRRDISMSGAEYDPERPLNQIMAGVGRMSMLDDPSKSKHVRPINFFQRMDHRADHRPYRPCKSRPTPSSSTAPQSSTASSSQATHRTTAQYTLHPPCPMLRHRPPTPNPVLLLVPNYQTTYVQSPSRPRGLAIPNHPRLSYITTLTANHRRLRSPNAIKGTQRCSLPTTRLTCQRPAQSDASPILFNKLPKCGCSLLLPRRRLLRILDLRGWRGGLRGRLPRRNRVRVRMGSIDLRQPRLCSSTSNTKSPQRASPRANRTPLRSRTSPGATSQGTSRRAESSCPT